MLGVMSHSFSSNMVRTHNRNLVGLRWSFFFLSSFFSLMPLKFMLSLPMNNYVLQFIILMILVVILLIIIYFDVFLSLTFFQFRPWPFILFDFYIIFCPSTFDCSIFFFMFYTFLDYFFLQFHSLPFYCVYFFNSIFILVFFIVIFLLYSWFIFFIYLFCPSIFYFI